MGRRALRKIDPSLDLSESFYEIDSLPQPLDPNGWFGRVAPLEIEVGSGKGLFLVTAAAAHPERNFLGTEISRKYAQYAASRLAKRQLSHAKMVCGDALHLFREVLPDRCAAAVHVYFPDPWWKKRHKKRRIMRAEFVKDVERVLRPDGLLLFWTDVEEYFQTTVELISEATGLEGPFEVPQRPAEHDLDYRTHFERRKRLDERPIYRAEFRKPA